MPFGEAVTFLLALNGSCNFSGGTINVGKKIAMKTKKLIKLAVSTLADTGRVFRRNTNFGPMMAPRIIFTA